MAEVIHTRKGKYQYKYEHTREGDKVVSRYMYPVDGVGDRVKPYQKKVAQQTGLEHEEVTQHKVYKLNTRPNNKDLDWHNEVFKKKWIRKYGEVVDPNTNEILAHVVLEINDFTRRGVKIKLTKWFPEFATDQETAGFIMDRVTRQDAMVFAGDSSWVRLNRTK